MKLFQIDDSRVHQQAVTDLSCSRTWQQLEHRVCQWAQLFTHEFGLQPGDHIALHVSNRVEFIEAVLAGIVSGLWVTPINTHLSSAEAAYILDNCDARLLLHDADNCSLVNNQTEVLCVNVTDQVFTDSENGDPAALVHEDLPAGGAMLYTSGTTGRPKGVMRAKPEKLGDAIARMQLAGRAFGLKGAGAHLVTGPLYHAAPMLFALYDLLNGAPMVIMPRWDEGLFLECVGSYGIATTHLVPTMMVRLLRHREQVSSAYCTGQGRSLSLVLHGAAPVARHTKQAMLDWWGDILVEYWGGSEAGVTTLVSSAEWRHKPGTVGKPLPHFSVFVGDAQGNPVSEKEGELYCRHRDLPQVFSYYKDPDKTARAHPQPYVFSIGDSGYLDADGYVFLSGRRSDLIISGGVNIYPAEIEQALMIHGAIEDCAVTGMPDDEWGEQAVAALQLREDCNLSGASENTIALEQELKQFLAERVARFKIPRRFVVVEQIPRMPTGKVRRSALEKLLQDSGLAAQASLKPAHKSHGKIQ